jgi:hypothetical protein
VDVLAWAAALSGQLQAILYSFCSQWQNSNP